MLVTFNDDFFRAVTQNLQTVTIEREESVTNIAHRNEIIENCIILFAKLKESRKEMQKFELFHLSHATYLFIIWIIHHISNSLSYEIHFR